jgi:hypothetical protein
MLTNPNPLQDPKIRYLFDHLVDSIKDQSLILWEALDTHTQEKVWMLGRNLGEGKVLPMGQLLPDSTRTVQRFAPSNLDGTWDFSQIKDPNAKIITPS